MSRIGPAWLLAAYQANGSEAWSKSLAVGIAHELNNPVAIMIQKAG
jgi:hypothetical protein